MTAIAASLLTLCGVFFLVVAGIGVLRLPDLFCRTSATTKAATLGSGCLLLAAMLHFGKPQVTARGTATIAFLLLTSPVAGHLIGRAAYRRGVPLWKETVRDEWGERGSDTAPLHEHPPQPL